MKNLHNNLNLSLINDKQKFMGFVQYKISKCYINEKRNTNVSAFSKHSIENNQLIIADAEIVATEKYCLKMLSIINYKSSINSTAKIKCLYRWQEIGNAYLIYSLNGILLKNNIPIVPTFSVIMYLFYFYF